MKTKFSESSFARLYLWVSKAKFSMGILFVAFTLLYLFLGIINGVDVSIDLFSALQMVFACFFIGIAQQLILPKGKLSSFRCALFVVCGGLVTLAFGLGFGWFVQFPSWCMPSFILIMALGMIAMVVSDYLELHRETKLLNRKLAQFQSKKQQAG